MENDIDIYNNDEVMESVSKVADYFTQLLSTRNNESTEDMPEDSKAA